MVADTLGSGGVGNRVEKEKDASRGFAPKRLCRRAIGTNDRVKKEMVKGNECASSIEVFYIEKGIVKVASGGARVNAWCGWGEDVLLFVATRGMLMFGPG